MTKNLIAEKLYPWKRCIPVDERSDWELLTYNPDDFFGTSMLFRHRENSSYALGVVAETSGGDRFYTVPVLSDIFFAVRQTEDIWVILVFDGSEEHMMRIRFSPGKEPAVLTAEPLSSEVNRCIVNRRGHILIGYDNSGFFSDTQNIEDFSPIADISISHAFAGENGIVLPLMEWYDSDGKLIHMFTDNINTTVTELTIDAEDRALIALDLSDALVRLEPGRICFEEQDCLHGKMIEGITEAKDHSGYLLSFAADEHDVLQLPWTEPFPQTVWLNPGGDPAVCRTFSETGAELPMDSYSCRANTILIEDEGWIFRLML